MDQKNEAAYWLCSIKKASWIANYELKRQALTNKDQRAVLPCYFLTISSGHATAIVVWCKQRYVAWPELRQCMMLIQIVTYWACIQGLMTLDHHFAELMVQAQIIFEFDWRQVQSGCAEDMSKIRWAVARVGTCNWDDAHTHSYRFSAMIQRGIWDQFGLGYLIQVVVLLAIL